MNPKHLHLGRWSSKMSQIFGFNVKVANVIQIGFPIYHCKGFEAQIQSKLTLSISSCELKEYGQKKGWDQSGNLTPNH